MTVMQRVFNAIGWMLAGMVVMAAVGWFALPRFLFIDRPSNRPYDETLTRLNNALNNTPGWRVVSTNDYSAPSTPAAPVDRMGTLTVSNPKLAAQVLSDDKKRTTTALMPFALGVYEDDSGQVHVVRLNLRVLGMMMGGTANAGLLLSAQDLKDVVAVALSGQPAKPSLAAAH